MSKLPVLVTGGAGYIGSHAVLALKDAGWPVAVIDNLSTGFRWAVPEGVAFYQGDVGDEALLARIFAEQGTRAVMHFAGSIIVLPQPSRCECRCGPYPHSGSAACDTTPGRPGPVMGEAVRQSLILPCRRTLPSTDLRAVSGGTAGSRSLR